MTLVDTGAEHDDRRPRETHRTLHRRRYLHGHLRRRAGRRRHRQAAGVPSQPRQAGHRDQPCGPSPASACWNWTARAGSSSSPKSRQSDGWVNAGFFVFHRRVFDYLNGGDACIMEHEPLERLAADRPVGRLSPRRLLLRHGHLPRIRGAQQDVGLGQHALEGVVMPTPFADSVCRPLGVRHRAHGLQGLVAGDLAAPPGGEGDRLCAGRRRPSPAISRAVRRRATCWRTPRGRRPRRGSAARGRRRGRAGRGFPPGRPAAGPRKLSQPARDVRRQRHGHGRTCWMPSEPLAGRASWWSLPATSATRTGSRCGAIARSIRWAATIPTAPARGRPKSPWPPIAARSFPPERLAEHGVKLATARAGNVIGGGDWAKDRIVTDIVRHLAAGQPVPVRNPRAVRPWQHVLEPLAGYLTLAARMLESDDPRWCDAWNFGPLPGEEIPVCRLVELFVAGLGRRHMEGRERSQPAARSRTCCGCASTRRSINWLAAAVERGRGRAADRPLVSAILWSAGQAICAPPAWTTSSPTRTNMKAIEPSVILMQRCRREPTRSKPFADAKPDHPRGFGGDRRLRLALARSVRTNGFDLGGERLSAGVHGRDASASERTTPRAGRFGRRVGPQPRKSQGPICVLRREARFPPDPVRHVRSDRRGWADRLHRPCCQPGKPQVLRRHPAGTLKANTLGTYHSFGSGASQGAAGIPVFQQRGDLRRGSTRRTSPSAKTRRLRLLDRCPLLLRRKQAGGRDDVR